MITKVAFVAHPTKNMESMKQFYGEHLGLEQSADIANMWCEFVAPDGKTVALDTFSAQSPDATPYMALETDDIEGDLQRLKNVGVTVVRDLWANNNEEGREVCKMALVADPDGNPVMLHQTADWRLHG
ncbi:MAG: VOC family protein [Acidobacteriota bacterium]